MKITQSRNKREGRYVGRWQGLAYRSRAEDSAFDELCARFRLYRMGKLNVNGRRVNERFSGTGSAE